jgi:hypothetical protein
LPQRARNENGLLDLWVDGLLAGDGEDGLLDSWSVGLRMSDVVVGLCVVVFIVFVCVLFG